MVKTVGFLLLMKVVDERHHPIKLLIVCVPVGGGWPVLPTTPIECTCPECKHRHNQYP